MSPLNTNSSSPCLPTHSRPVVLSPFSPIRSPDAIPAKPLPTPAPLSTKRTILVAPPVFPSLCSTAHAHLVSSSVPTASHSPVSIDLNAAIAAVLISIPTVHSKTNTDERLMMKNFSSAPLTVAVSPISLTTGSNLKKRFVIVIEPPALVPTVHGTAFLSISNANINSVLHAQTVSPVAFTTDYNSLDKIALSIERTAHVVEPNTAQNSAVAVVDVSDDVEDLVLPNKIQTILASASRDVKEYVRTHEQLEDVLKSLRVTGVHNGIKINNTFISAIKLIQLSRSIETLLDIVDSFCDFDVNCPPTFDIPFTSVKILNEVDGKDFVKWHLKDKPEFKRWAGFRWNATDCH